MIKHYFKVAFRNLWKYKSQTLISVIGLAVGFACFAMAMLWILLTFLLTLAVFRRRTLNLAIRSGNRKLFRKITSVFFLLSDTTLLRNFINGLLNEMRFPDRRMRTSSNTLTCTHCELQQFGN